ncbi:MAG TPA: TIGR00153 family protein [Phycisphaerales bacterium]|nr:TIGR00153 family protein [Phycisphaerales bacterium]
MSKSNLFRRLLRESPLQLVQEHMRVVCECVHQISPLIEAMIVHDRAKILECNDIISERESAADAIKNQLRAHLPNSLFLPVDRTDVLQIIQKQDAIADTAEDIAGLLVARDMDTPEVLLEPLLALVHRNIDACDQLAELIEELDELLEVGFKGRDAQRVEEMVVALSRTESETDGIGKRLVHTLFENEDSMKPVSVMFMFQLARWLGNIGDDAEDVGDRVRLLIAR